jgi:hypothetical protein
MVHFPEGRTLAADDADEGEDGGEEGGGDGGGGGGREEDTSPLRGHPAGLDPCWLVPFCVQALRERSFAPGELAESGCLGVCLRALASGDPGMRWAAAEAVALAAAALEEESAARVAAAADPADPASSASSFSVGGRSAPQLRMLLRALRPAVARGAAAASSSSANGSSSAFLSPLLAVFAADASLALGCPGPSPASAAAFSALCRALLRSPTPLGPEDVPMLKQMSGGGRDAVAGRSRLLELLRAGLVDGGGGGGDGGGELLAGPSPSSPYRSHFVLDLLAPLATAASPLAESRETALAAAEVLAAAPLAAPALAATAAAKGALAPALASGFAASAAEALLAPCSARPSSSSSFPCSAGEFDEQAAALAARALRPLDALLALARHSGSEAASSAATGAAPLRAAAAAAADALLRIDATSSSSSASFSSSSSVLAARLWSRVLMLALAVEESDSSAACCCVGKEHLRAARAAAAAASAASAGGDGVTVSAAVHLLRKRCRALSLLARKKRELLRGANAVLEGGWRESFGLPPPAPSEGGGEDDDGDSESDGDEQELKAPSSSARRPRSLLALDALSLVLPEGSDGVVSTMLRSAMRLAAAAGGGSAR